MDVQAFENDLSQRRPVDDHLQKTLNFVIEHESILSNITRAVSCAIGEACETHYRPIRVGIDHSERVLHQDLLNSHTSVGDDILQKVLTVLVYLIDEVRELKEMAETKLYGPLIMFGQNPPEAETSGQSPSSSYSVTSASSTALDPQSTAAYREKMLGRFLPTMQDVTNFVERCYNVTLNIVQQLSSLLNSKEALYRATFQTTHLMPMLQALGEMLTVLITLDCIIEQNEFLQDAWASYKLLISYARADPEAFGTTESGVIKFERLLVTIDQTIMIGEIFKGCIEQNFESAIDTTGKVGGDSGDDFDNIDDQEIRISVRQNQTFLDEMLLCLKTHIDNALSIIGTSMELFERQDVVASFALYALYRALLPPNVAPDGKLHKVLWGVQKTVPLVILCEKVVWNLGEFLQSHAPFEIKKPDPPNPAAYRRTYVSQFDASLSQKTALLVSQVSAWLVLTESKLQPSLRHETNIAQALDIRGSILLKGLALASRAQYLAKACLTMHSSMQVPMSRASLNDVALLVESLKAIEFTYIRKDIYISEVQTHLIKVISQAIVSIIYPYRSKLETAVREIARDVSGRGMKASKLDTAKMDLLFTLSIMENIIRSTDNFGVCRQSILLLCAEIVVGSKLFNEKEALKLRGFVRRLAALANVPRDIRNVCNTSFLFFHTGILPTIINNIYQHPTEANRLQYILGAFNDGVRICQMVAHSDVAPFYLNYRALIRSAICKEIIEPLCRDIETDLRLHIHTKHLDHMASLNPKAENLKPLRSFLEVAPLRVLGLIINIKQEVAHYLDLNFYNLTTVALHDWRTYSDMRSLAADKFGLILMDNFLPMGSLEQGLDVLQIMRNIHIFVSRFCYNMNTQQFIEYRPDKASKHLNTIKIQSIAASIRQHGLGVLNTTVNFTYQFLAQKFHIFSQFLFDEYIRAHLSREHRWYKKHKNEPEVNNMYPYDRALKLVRDIRKLGVNEAGKTYLDQFRILITEIGNALGYVRMVRSASMYYCSEAVKFLPEMDDIISFKKWSGSGGGGDGGEASGGANLSPETQRAAKNLDEVISTLVKNFGEGSDYFKVLVNVFQSVLLTAEHDHLRTFYMIVPSLCISWLDAALQAKEAVYKVVRGPMKEMYFTDDGFAMGIAYCLAILKQTRKNEALHWVDTVRQKHRVDLKALEEQQARRAKKKAEMKERKDREEKAKRGILNFFKKKKEGEEEEEDHEDMEEIHTLQLTAKRLEAQRRETDQLFYSMTGAGIFFKRTDVET